MATTRYHNWKMISLLTHEQLNRVLKTVVAPNRDKDVFQSFNSVYEKVKNLPTN
jgi:hypothetical protein